MMDRLPFEQDLPELLEAVSPALAAVRVHPARTQPERAAYAVWQREAAEHAPVRNMSEAAPETGTVFSRPDPAALYAGPGAEDLSREIERDARRFQAN